MTTAVSQSVPRMAICGGAEMVMTFIPPGTQVILADNRVVLVFPEENDAIMFIELVHETQRHAVELGREVRFTVQYVEAEDAAD